MMNLLLLTFIGVWTSINARLEAVDYVERIAGRQLLLYAYDAMEEEEMGPDGEVIEAMNHVNQLFYETFKGEQMGAIGKKFELWKKQTYGAGLHKRHKKKWWVAENLLDLGVNFAVGGNIIGAAYETIAANTLAEYMGLVPEHKKVTSMWKHSGLAMFAEKVLKDMFKGAATGATAGAITGALTGVAAGCIFPPAIGIFPATALGGAALGGLVGATWGTVKGTIKGIYMLYRNNIKKKKFKEMAWSDYAEEAVIFHFDELPFHYQQKLLFTLDTIAEQNRIKTDMWSDPSKRDIKREMANSMRFIDAFDEDLDSKKRKHFDPKAPVLPILKEIFPEDSHPKIKNEFHKMQLLYKQSHSLKPKKKSVSTKQVNMGSQSVMQLPGVQELLKAQRVWDKMPPKIIEQVEASPYLLKGVAVYVKVNDINPEQNFKENVHSLLSPPKKPLPSKPRSDSLIVHTGDESSPKPVYTKKRSDSLVVHTGDGSSPKPYSKVKTATLARDEYFNKYYGNDVEDDFDRYYKKQNMYTYGYQYDMNDMQFNNIMIGAIFIVICGVGFMICLGSLAVAMVSALACYVWKKREEKLKLNATENNDMPQIYVEE